MVLTQDRLVRGKARSRHAFSRFLCAQMLSPRVLLQGVQATDDDTNLLRMQHAL